MVPARVVPTGMARAASSARNAGEQEGLKARRKDRRFGLRSARHFAASRGEIPPLTRRCAMVERRYY